MGTRKILVAFAVVILCFGHTARAGSNDVEQIGTLENNLAAAAEAKNLDAIMKAYIPDGTLFVFDVIPPREYVPVSQITLRSRNRQCRAAVLPGSCS